MEQEDAKPSPSLPQPVILPPVVGPTIDLISKSVAAFALVLYGCGFLITSIHNSSYGFMETNPFRPKIVSAGVWFILFAAIPIALVAWIKGFQGKSVIHRKWLRRFSTALFVYGAFSVAFGLVFVGYLIPGLRIAPRA